jgi:hypothetical protein
MACEKRDPAVKRIALRLLGRKVTMPAGELLLRGFQFLYGDRISMGRFCWNNECGNCEVRCILPGETRERTVRACMYDTREGMRITRVPVEFQVIMQEGAEGEDALLSAQPSAVAGRARSD